MAEESREEIKEKVSKMSDEEIQEVIDEYDSNDPACYRRGQLAMAEKENRRQERPNRRWL